MIKDTIIHVVKNPITIGVLAGTGVVVGLFKLFVRKNTVVVLEETGTIEEVA